VTDPGPLAQALRRSGFAVAGPTLRLLRAALGRLACLRNRVEESRDIAEIAARHLAPPARPA
jgi:hypothetical protein